MLVLIVGGGTMGREIAKTLKEHEIVLVDKDDEVCERNSHELDATVLCGDCRRIHVLEQAGLDNSDVVFAVTNNDEVNLLLALLSKKKGKKVLARVKETDYIDLFKELGIEGIIAPEQNAAIEVAEKIM